MTLQALAKPFETKSDRGWQRSQDAQTQDAVDAAQYTVPLTRDLSPEQLVTRESLEISRQDAARNAGVQAVYQHVDAMLTHYGDRAPDSDATRNLGDLHEALQAARSRLDKGAEASATQHRLEE
ncbi:MAG: hypothetical protein HOV68_24575 [Streptomycetaceae bacterium]|nr:hypothetical protein [Streptomycetaceae bacterium]